MRTTAAASVVWRLTDSVLCLPMGSLESATETTAVISSSIAELAALAREREQCSPQDYIPSHTFRDEIERSAIDTPVELR